jgi:hypothetical protein
VANQENVSRRKLLALCGRGLALAPVASFIACGRTAPVAAVQNPGGAPFQGTDEQLLDEIEKGSFQFFWNETNPHTLVCVEEQ